MLADKGKTGELVSNEVLQRLQAGDAAVQKDGSVERWHFGDEGFNKATAEKVVNFIPSMMMMNRSALSRNGALHIIDAGGALGEMSRFMNRELAGHRPNVPYQFH